MTYNAFVPNKIKETKTKLVPTMTGAKTIVKADNNRDIVVDTRKRGYCQVHGSYRLETDTKSINSTK
jgi:hypothetical protein